MSLKEEEAEEFAMHACKGACDSRQERDAVVVGVSVLIFVNFSFSGMVQRGVRGVRVGDVIIHCWMNDKAMTGMLTQCSSGMTSRAVKRKLPQRMCLSVHPTHYEDGGGCE